MYQAVFFDIDNTLLFKQPGISEKVFEIVSAHTPDVEREAVERAYAASELWQGQQIMKENETGVRMPDEEYIAHMAGVYGRILKLESAVVQELAEKFTQGYENQYILAPDALEILERLRESGMHLGIVSNNHGKVRNVLEEMGIAHFFDPVIISEEAELYKPDAAIMELACERIGTEPSKCIYVGDHPFDILCAHAAHMPVIWLPVNGFMEVPDSIGAPEYTAASLKDAMNYIINENKKG